MLAVKVDCAHEMSASIGASEGNNEKLGQIP